jgi:hypothetical protein
VQEAAADDNTCIEQTCKRAKNGVCLKQLCMRHCVEAGGPPCGCHAHAVASATRAEANAEPATSDQPHTFGPLLLWAGKHAGFTFTSLLTRRPSYCAWAYGEFLDRSSWSKAITWRAFFQFLETMRANGQWEPLSGVHHRFP